MISFTIGRVGDEGTANELWGRRTWIMVLKPGGGVTSYKTKKTGTSAKYDGIRDIINYAEQK